MLALPDYTRAELRPRPHNAARRETFIPVICPLCHGETWLRRHDARKWESGRVQQCGTCQRKAAGRRGYQVTTKRYGEKISVKWLRQYLLENPSSLEVAMMLILADIGITNYSREYWLQTKASGKRRRVYLIDFVLPGYLAIEVNGEYVHSSKEAKRRDMYKQRYIRKSGFKLLVIEEKDIRSGNAIDLVAAFVEGARQYA